MLRHCYSRLVRGKNRVRAQGDASAPQGKARLLYEVAPMGYLAEQAGGMAMWGETAEKRVMEVVPQNIHQRSPMFVGSTSMVKDLQEFLADPIVVDEFKTIFQTIIEIQQEQQRDAQQQRPPHTDEDQWARQGSLSNA